MACIGCVIGYNQRHQGLQLAAVGDLSSEAGQRPLGAWWRSVSGLRSQLSEQKQAQVKLLTFSKSKMQVL